MFGNHKNNLAITLILLVTSCHVMEPVSTSIRPEEFLLTGSIESHAPETRTALANDYSTVLWKSEDIISLLSLTGGYAPFAIESGIDSPTGVFSGEICGDAPYLAFYPDSWKPSVSSGILHFQLPQTQAYVRDSFGPDASPMVANVSDVSSPFQFKNLCGMLCLKLTAEPSIKVSRIVIRDLSGKQLWGDCALVLDGNEGTANQNMSISGGNDEITLNIYPPLGLPDSESAKIYVVVPPGSFASGFAVTIYNEENQEVKTLQTLNPEVQVARSRITNMASYGINDVKTESGDPHKRGFYKDLFMDSGIKLNSFTTRPAFPYIEWDFEYFATPFYDSYTEEDVAMQNSIFVSSEDDENGALLYPDRQPRFRCIYVNGGDSKSHGSSLEEKGRKTIYDFVYNGGSYVGTCAGAFLACKYRDSDSKPIPNYVAIFPGRMMSTGISADTVTDLTMEADSPLKSYYFFGETIASIRHHSGGYMSEKTGDYPIGTEIFMRYSNCPKGKEAVNGKVAIWSYKPNAETGRMVLCGSHPEKAPDGDGRNLFASMLLYAADGNGTPPIKATLSKGVTYDCTSMSSENNPAHARIGDKQYHHFKLEIPEGAEYVTLTLESEFVDDDLYLSLRKDDYAWFSEADYTRTSDGSNKILKIRSLEAGTYYVSVYAPNTVTATIATYASKGSYYKYSGKTHLLNGIPYTLTVDWKIRNDKDGGNENFKGQDDLGDDFEFEFD